MKYKHLLILSVPILIFFVLEVLILKSFLFFSFASENSQRLGVYSVEQGRSFFNYSSIVYFSIFILSFLIFFTSWFIVREKINIRQWSKFLFFPWIFFISITSYVFILSDVYFIYFLLFLNSLLLFFYFRNIFFYIIRSDLYKDGALSNISSYGGFLIVFFIGSFSYGAQTFLNLSKWPLLIILFFIFLFLFDYIFWINNISRKELKYLPIVLSIALLEVAYSLFWLPFAYNTLGLILAIFYYLISESIKAFLNQKLDKRRLKIYLFIAISSVFLILFTSRVN